MRDSIAAYEIRAEDRQHTPKNIVSYLRGGAPSALPWRHYGWNVHESPGKPLLDPPLTGRFRRLALFFRKMRDKADVL